MTSSLVLLCRHIRSQSSRFDIAPSVHTKTAKAWHCGPSVLDRSGRRLSLAQSKIARIREQASPRRTFDSLINTHSLHNTSRLASGKIAEEEHSTQNVDHSPHAPRRPPKDLVHKPRPPHRNLQHRLLPRVPDQMAGSVPTYRGRGWED
jgi:hypothetical protein